MEYFAGEFNVAVIGAGHAGIEAALASARLGVSTVIFTVVLDGIGNMPCNPSIGGTAKGHLVREIDALGGEMGKAADTTFIQSRMLNKGKGPAVHSLRVQTDRRQYHLYMKKTLENQVNLEIKQAEIVDVRANASGEVCSVVTRIGAIYNVKAVVIATGTYLESTIFVGDSKYSGGPDGMQAAIGLSEKLRKLGVTLRRFKTGTPARVHSRSIDYTKLELQDGDEPIVPFSFETDPKQLVNKAVCHIAYTNSDTHEVIKNNLHRSPLYSGKIEGVGPRYCPSIEDKVVRFSDKPRHQLFIEPCGLDTSEMYLQGMSSSLPEDVQNSFLKTIEGLENVEVMRVAYAIEYDCCDTTQLTSSLEFKDVSGLFGAGQFNGTSGYEEAAAQGLVAGINAARKVKGLTPVYFARSGSYIGTLIDDLVTKGVSDPYRMMTSRSEYRLILRQDNADSRLTELGHEIGLISNTRLECFLNKQRQIELELKRLSKTVFPPTKELNSYLEKIGTPPLKTGVNAYDLLKRPQVFYKDLAPFDIQRQELSDDITEQVEITIKYEGYIKRQLMQIESTKKLENQILPHNIDYKIVKGLRIEACEKLNKIRPYSLGQAMRISGVSPADISVLIIFLQNYI